MQTKDWCYLIATIVSPIVAAVGGAWLAIFWQGRKQKLDAKERLFLTLMALRQSKPPAIEWVNALNTIDVVFVKDKPVLDLWHRYYEMLANPPVNQNFEIRDHLYLDLLSEMALAIGYKMKITDIAKFYSPQAHVDQMLHNAELQVELLRVLKNSGKLKTKPLSPPVQ
jgi:hypothetical protein